MGAIKKLFSKKTKISKRKTPSRTSSISQRYHPEDDLQFATPPTPSSALILDLTADTDVTNLLLQNVGGEEYVFDWELGASFGNLPGEADTLSDTFGGIHLNEQSEDAGDDISEISSVLSQGSSRLRNRLVRSRTQTSCSSSTSTGNRNKAPRISRRVAKVNENDEILHSLGLFTTCIADNVKSLTEAVTALKNSPQSRPYGEYIQNIPWTAPKMDLSTGGKVSVKDFIIFQRACLNQIKNLGVSQAKVLAYLQNSPHCLPKDMRSSVRLCTSLDKAFKKMASSLP